MSLHRLRICRIRDENDMPTAGCAIYLDNEQIYGVTEVDVHIEADAPSTATISICLQDIDLDDNVNVKTEKTYHNDILAQPVAALGLSVRPYNAFMYGYFRSHHKPGDQERYDPIVADLAREYKAGKLKDYRNLGRKSFDEIRYRLKEAGLIGEYE